MANAFKVIVFYCYYYILYLMENKSINIFKFDLQFVLYIYDICNYV